MNPLESLRMNLTRRHFFTQGSHLLGGMAIASLSTDQRLLQADASSGLSSDVERVAGAAGPHFAPKAKHVIYLHMVGGPPQMDLYDYKPAMNDWYDKDLPETIRNGQRLTTMTSGQAKFPVAPTIFKFKQHVLDKRERQPNPASNGNLIPPSCFLARLPTTPQRNPSASFGA